MKSQNNKEQKSDFSYKETLNLLKTDFSMRANSVVREPEIQNFWANNNVDFELGKNNSGKTFTLHDGPPYANGALHMGHALNKVLIRSLTESTSKINDSSISSMVSSLTPLIKALTWTIGSIFFLQNIGVQMTAIWALLSAGGIGAGLALKDPVQEFFEYITILLDKPFQKGEFIKSDGVLGMVERVGVRSSRIRSINGEVIVMSNSALTNGIISNYAQMEKRRLVHKLGVVYETSPKLMKLIPIIIKKIVEETKDASFDRCHFTDFGDFSLNFELVYYIPTNNYLAAMEAQQSIKLRIIEEFALNNIEFAFPTQTLNIESNKTK